MTLGSESCDDGNLINLDGCNFVCSIESGWLCTANPAGPPSVCTGICGLGYVFPYVGGITCQDGNAFSFDGCDYHCHLENGWTGV